MAKLLLYGEIGWGVSSQEVIEYLDEHKDEAVEMHVNSPGGDVFEAIAIRSAVIAHNDLTIVVDSLAASAAAIISLCGKPLKVADYSRMMLHSASTFAAGNSKEMEEATEMLKSIDRDLAAMIADKLGKTQEEVLDQYFDGKDHWLSSAEVIEMGIATKYEEQKTEDSTSAVFDRIFGFGVNNNKPKQNYKTMDLSKFQTVAAFADCQNEDEVVEKATQQAQDLEKAQAEIAEKDAKIAEDESAIADKDEKIKELEEKVAQFEAEKAQAQENADKEVVENAIKEGKISEDMRETYINMMKSDRENTTKVIDSLQAPADPASVTDFIKNSNNGTPKASPFQEELRRIAGKQ